MKCYGCEKISSKECGKIVANRYNGAAKYEKVKDKRCKEVKRWGYLDEKVEKQNHHQSQ